MMVPAGKSSSAGGEQEVSYKSVGWPQFRGPDGQGHVFGPIPTTWSESVNNKWSVAIPGKGWSSPVILEGKVWMTTAVAKPSGDQSLRAIGVDAESGKIVHDTGIALRLFKPNPKKVRANNTYATLRRQSWKKAGFCAHFGCYGNACVDTTTGAILWKNETLVVDFDTGPASSPLLYKDRLICVYDGMDLQYCGRAQHVSCGEVLWKTDRLEGKAEGQTEWIRRALVLPLAHWRCRPGPGGHSRCLLRLQL